MRDCKFMMNSSGTGDENKALLMEMGAVPPLLKLITSEEKTVRRNAIMTLGVLSAHRTWFIASVLQVCKISLDKHLVMVPSIPLLHCPIKALWYHKM